MSTVDEWLNELAMRPYSAMLTLGSLIWFKGCCVVIMTHIHQTLEWKSGILAKGGSISPSLLALLILYNKSSHSYFFLVLYILKIKTSAVSVWWQKLGILCLYVSKGVLDLYFFLLDNWQLILVAVEDNVFLTVVFGIKFNDTCEKRNNKRAKSKFSK